MGRSRRGRMEEEEEEGERDRSFEAGSVGKIERDDLSGRVGG